MKQDLYFSRVERRNFGDLLSNEKLIESTIRRLGSDEQVNPVGHGLVAIWNADPREAGFGLPVALVCEDGTETDWSAWITTYVARLRPFSAYFHLLSRSQFGWLRNSRRRPTMRRIGSAAAGLILGEVFATSRLPDRVLGTLPAVAFSSTLSFAMFRTAALFDSFDEWPYLLRSWELVRAVTAQRPRTLPAREVAAVCHCLILAGQLQLTGAKNLADIEPDVLLACGELVERPARPPALFMSRNSFAVAFEQMHGGREERVVAMSNFIAEVSTSNSSGQLIAMMLGFLASRIAPGTLQHFSVLTPVVLERHPASALWYGVCAGLAVSERGGGGDSGPRLAGADLPPVARRIARDLLRDEPAFGAPSGDIGIIELVSLSQTGNPLPGLVTTTTGTATVELLPGVLSVVNVPSNKSDSIPRHPPVVESSTLSELAASIERLQKLFNVLSGHKPTDDQEARQAVLFPARKRGKK